MSLLNIKECIFHKENQIPIFPPSKRLRWGQRTTHTVQQEITNKMMKQESRVG